MTWIGAWLGTWTGGAPGGLPEFTRARLRDVHRLRLLLVLAVAVLSLAGCWQSQRDTSGHQRIVERIETHPTVGGGTLVVRQQTLHSDERSSATGGADLAAIAQQVAPVMRAVGGAATGIDWAQVIGLGSAALVTGGSAAAAWLKSKEAKVNRADSDEAWGRLVPPPPPGQGSPA